MDDSDLAGPVLFFFLFGSFLLLSGKLHFGYIYGLALLGSVSLHLILSLMSPFEAGGASGGPGSAAPQPPPYASSGYPADPSAGGAGGAGGGAQGGHDGHLSSTLTYIRSTSVLGYCLLPLVLTSLIGVATPMDTPLGIVVTTFAIMWCTYSASGMFCAVGRMRGMRGLVAYPLALFYVGFGIMGVFSSRGSGSMAKAMSGGRGA
jgi:protein YIPF5/7